MGVGGQRYTLAALQEAGWAPGPFWTGAENLAGLDGGRIGNFVQNMLRNLSSDKEILCWCL
jgi:hypothetical protein